MNTYTGTQFWPMDPHTDEVFIEDIAHGLSMQCRFNGHTRKFYSVAEHSVLASLLVPAKYAMEALLHDAAEAYVGDVIRPLKRLPEFAFFHQIEERVELVIAQRFQLHYPWPADVKKADEALVRTELDVLIDYNEANDNQRLHDKNVPAADVKIMCHSPQVAKDLFLARYRNLSVHRYGVGA